MTPNKLEPVDPQLTASKLSKTLLTSHFLKWDNPLGVEGQSRVCICIFNKQCQPPLRCFRRCRGREILLLHWDGVKTEIMVLALRLTNDQWQYS